MNQGTLSAKQKIIFWIAALIIMLAGLGFRSLWGSEDRWAEVTRIMFQTGDFVHPSINGEVYFDKPLMSYWAIALVKLVTGSLNEFAIRLPSALGALIGLWGTIKLGSILRDEKTGYAAAWMLLSCYGFVFWGRTAAADMQNLTAIILAVTWFMMRKDKAGFFSYLLFYVICAAGAHMKGLAAIVIPPALAGLFVFLDGSWKKHITFAHIAAAIAGAAVYFIPFILAAKTALPEGYAYPPGLSADAGIYLVIRENIVRVFNPFDHKEPFFIYLYEVPRMMIPWCVAMLLVMIGIAVSFRKTVLSTERKWLYLSAIFIFAIFTASGSRRWYYILPLLPFITLIMADFMRSEEPLQERWRNLSLTVTKYLLFTICVIQILSIIAFHIAPSYLKVPELANEFLATGAGLMISGVLGLIPLMPRMQKHIGKFCGMDGKLGQLLISAFILSAGFFCVTYNQMEYFRTEKEFSLKLRNFDFENTAFYLKPAPKLLFYAKTDKPVKVLNSNKELAEFLNAGGDRYVICNSNLLKYFLPELPEAQSKPFMEEKRYKWENDEIGKLSLWKIIGKNK